MIANIKVLYLSYDGILDPLGQSQIIPYIKRLSLKGINYTILTFEKKVNLIDKGRIEQVNNELLNSGIKWKILKYHKRPSILAKLWDILAGFFISLRIVKKTGTTIIHARSYVMALIALILKRLFGVKFIFDMRGFWNEERVESGTYRYGSILYRIVRYFEKMFLKSADKVIVLNNASKSILRRTPYLKDKDIQVIPTCVDTDVFLSQSNLSKRRLGLDGKFVMVYFGSIGALYGFKEMVDFFYILSKYLFANSLFLIITNNPSTYIYQILQLKGIPSEKYRIDRMTYEEIKEVIPLADASLIFYSRPLSKSGCCPTKFGESLACGLPVVINSGIGDTEEIVRKEMVGIVVDEFSDMAYKKAAEQLRQLLSEGDGLKKRCRAVAERYFSLTEGLKKYWQIYQNLLKV